MSVVQCGSQVRMCSSIPQNKPRITPSTFPFPFPFRLKPFVTKLQEIWVDFPPTMKKNSVKLIDAAVDSVFVFVDQPLLPSQSNFAPVQEVEEAFQIDDPEGCLCVPDDFPDGVYIRNGPNPLFGCLKSAVSVFGKSSGSWMEGEGMVHSIHLKKCGISGKWNISYNNRYVKSDTFLSEKQRNKPSFLPAIEGHPLPVLTALLLNWLRFGTVDKYYSNTNIIEHCGRYYATAENHSPQEIDIITLNTLGSWHLQSTWNRPFTSHPKKIVSTGELVIYGISGLKPYLQLGIVSADGEKLNHKVHINLNRCILCHDIGVTQRYIVILDFPLTIDITRPVQGGPLLKFDNKGYARMGVMPHYGSEDSIRWFDVEACSVLHVFNCYEDEDEVVVMACKSRGSIVPGPEFGIEKYEWFSRGLRNTTSVAESDEIDSQDGLLFTRAYEWRLNIVTGDVKQRYLTGPDFPLELPFINEQFTGSRNKYGYAQVRDSTESSNAGMPKFGGLAKLHFEEITMENSLENEEAQEELIKVEYHEFPERTYCSGATFVPKPGGIEEDEGWIITFAHNEESDLSHVLIVDAKKISDPPVAKIALPVRVPYGFHGAFMDTSRVLVQQ